MPEGSTMKVAVVHDWLVTVGGSEKVLKQILTLYPDADLYCLLDFFKEDEREQFVFGKKSKTSYLQNIPLSKQYYRFMIPFLYKAVEKFNLKKYDLIISSSHAVAKGVMTHENQTHICYCHTPVRYVWNMKKTYLQQIPKRARKIAGNQLKRMKKWDLMTALKVNFFIANSQFVADRIMKNYGVTSAVINPPVDTKFYQLPGDGDQSPLDSPYYIVVSRLVHYKKVDLIIQAFNSMPDKKLIIIGRGPQKEALVEMAGDNITFLGFLHSDTMRSYMQHAEAMVLAAIEDFGITSLESQACGTPVIAFNFGGYRESVVHNKTGMLFDSQTPESLAKAVVKFEQEQSQFLPEQIRAHSMGFSSENFRRKMSNFIAEKFVPSEKSVQ